jgi:hypothetical protein
MKTDTTPPRPTSPPATPSHPCRVCGRRHRTWHAFAKCRWPRALWIAGSGPWASVAHCSHHTTPGPTVQLYRTHAGAAQAKAIIDSTGCGGCCSGAMGHKVVGLEVRNG